MLAHFFRKVGIQERMYDRLLNLDQPLTVYGDLRLVDDSLDIFDFFL
jgi:hypothetical protein